MKEVKTDMEGMPYTVTVPTCDTCANKKTVVEMVSPHTSGSVDRCKLWIPLKYPKECDMYKKNLKTKISELIDLT